MNFRTRQIQSFCRSVCEDPLYRRSVLERARTGTLGAMEPVILAYAYGKPKETIELQVGPLEEDLSSLSIEELAQRAEDMTRQLREAKELNEALPAEYRSADVTSIRQPDSPRREDQERLPTVNASSEAAKDPAVPSADATEPAKNPAESRMDDSVNATSPAVSAESPSVYAENSAESSCLATETAELPAENSASVGLDASNHAESRKADDAC